MDSRRNTCLSSSVRGKRIYIETHGCRTNLADSSALARYLLEAGATLAGSPADADVVVVLSCTVTAGADRDAGKALRRSARENPDARRILAGCIPSAFPGHAAFADAHRVVPGSRPEDVARAIGTEHGGRALLWLPRAAAPMAPGPGQPFVPSAQADHGKELLSWSPGSPPPPGRSTPSEARGEEGLAASAPPFPLEHLRRLSRAHIKIGEGCDGACSYCIVPKARGKPASRSASQVLADVEAAVRAGFPEIVLTGTHLARWGRDLKEPSDIVSLMSRIEEATSDQGVRMRLSSLEPDPGLERVVEKMAGSERWCRYMHVALQHAADPILAAMNRTYRFPDAEALLKSIGARLPGFGIGLDFIVGFPGETDELFDEALHRLEGTPFTYLHVFAFSPRQGTVAADLPGRPEKAAVDERSARLRALSAARRAAFAGSLVGSELDVVVEKRRVGIASLLTGLTDNYVRVYLEGRDDLMGRRVRCTAVAAEGATLRGEVRL